jgi:hypothetical protein
MAHPEGLGKRGGKRSHKAIEQSVDYDLTYSQSLGKSRTGLGISTFSSKSPHKVRPERIPIEKKDFLFSTSAVGRAIP